MKKEIFGAEMRIASIKKYLRPSTIRGRKSTIANAFASALAPYDDYDFDKIADAIRDLEQDPDSELECIYCGQEAATWDHVFNRVTKGKFSGHGHRIRNLVPCCRTCNERKGKKSWREFLEIRNPPDKETRVARMTRFLSRADAQPVDTETMKQKGGDELGQFLEIQSQVFELIEKADRLAAIIRQQSKS